MADYSLCRHRAGGGGESATLAHATLALKGCAVGLWGEEPARSVEALRAKWAE